VKDTLEQILNEKILEPEEDLKIIEQLVGIHSMNPFTPSNSSSRSYMLTSHFSQDISLLHGDTSIVQSGLESQFSKNTFSAKAEEDVVVLRTITRYNGVTINTVNAQTELLVIVADSNTGEIDYIDLPTHHTLHQYFGFEYKWNWDKLSELTRGSLLRKGEVLAGPHTVGENNAYKYGVNANIALMSLPEVAEDSVVISKSLAEKLSYKIYETRVINFGENKYPLNVYGDVNNYKAFPEIGELVRDDGILTVLRDIDDELSPALVTKNDVMTFNPIFDEAIYVKGPGEVKTIHGMEYKSGVVKDIKAIFNPKFKKDIYTGTANDVVKYVNGYKKYHEDIIKAYEELKEEHRKLYKDSDLKISEKFHRLLIDAYAIVNPDNNKIAYSYRKDECDLYRVEVTIEYTLKAIPGSKISDKAGSVLC